MVERLAALLRRLERDAELLLDARLPDEVGQPARTERLLDLVSLGEDRREELRVHAACLSASRTCSSTGRSRSTCASAASASSTE